MLRTGFVVVAGLGVRAAADCTAWAFNPAAYANTMTMTSYVTLDGAEVSTGTLAAFIDGELHALEDEVLTPPFGPYEDMPQYAITLYGDGEHDGLEITYELCVDGVTYALATPTDTGFAEADAFVSNGSPGDAQDPVLLEFFAPTAEPSHASIAFRLFFRASSSSSYNS